MNIRPNIRPYERNAKTHTKKQIDQLAKVVARVGWRQPVVVNQEGVIIVGHARYETWKQHPDLPPIWIIDDRGQLIHGGPATDELLPEDEAMWRLADNKLNESKWDMNLVIAELQPMPLEQITLTGFDSDLILETVEDEPTLPTGKVRTKLGDLYEFGEHKLICGDSEDPKTYEKLLGNERARLIFTDPPYSVNYESGGGISYDSSKFGGTGDKIFNDDKTPAEALEWYKKILTRLHEFSTNDATLYWWFANRLTDVNMQAWRSTKWRLSQQVFWLKNSILFSPGQLFHRIYEPCMVGWKDGQKHYQNMTFANMTEFWNLGKKSFHEYLDVWYQKRDNTSKYVHPTQKPVQLSERALKRSSEKGDIVLDAFGGSGSTMLGCEQLGRKCRLIELDPKYCDVIVKRYMDFTNSVELKLNGKKIMWKK